MAKNNLMPEQTEEEEKEAEKPGFKAAGDSEKRAHGGGLDAAMQHKTDRIKRKRGGHVPGKKGAERPDRRARGGATSDLNPTTAAGNMSVPDYENKAAIASGGGKGSDKASYGSNRRPG